MSKEGEFTIELEQTEGYAFRVRFDLQGADDLVMDEPPPLGLGHGPNPSRALAAAAAHCLSASLLYCVSKDSPPGVAIKTSATCRLGRNPAGRLRVSGMSIRLTVDGVLQEAARMKRCLNLFEDFCVVTASLREGFPVDVEVCDSAGEKLHDSRKPPASEAE